jgi:hypothetical protein
MTQPVFDIKVRDLAEKIYVDLMTRSIDISVQPPTVKADPKSLAIVSFKLAAAFHAVQDELNAENLPKNQDFKLNLADIAGWNK